MKIDDHKMIVKNNTVAGQFEIHVAGHLAVAEHKLRSERIIFTQTGVPEVLAGRRIAAKLARTALEYAKDQRLTVVPLCP